MLSASKPYPIRGLLAKAAIETLEQRRLLSTSVSSFHGDAASTGQNLTETTLSPSDVNVNTFGKLYTTAVDGQVYSQPLYQPGINISVGAHQGMHNVVYVETENDSLYAIDANSGTVLWQDSFLIANPALGSGVTVTTMPNGDVNSSDINPQIGITSTPVIGSGFLYLTAKTKQTVGGATHAVYMLFKVNIASGVYTDTVIADTTYSGSSYTYNSGPYVLDPHGAGAGQVATNISATNSSGGNVNVTHAVDFNALRQMNRAGLIIYNGNVYISFASHGDNGPYHGWILGYSQSNLAATAVLNLNPDGSDDGIWMGGGKISMDSSGNMYVETGNGTFDTTLNSSGFPQYGDYGDSFVKIALDPSTTGPNQVININGWGLKVVDYFTPYNQDSLSSADADMGSGAPIVLPTTMGSVTLGSAQHPNLLVGSGKNGTIYLIDTANMGKYSSTTDNVVQEVGGGVGGGGSYDTPGLYYNGSSVSLIYSGKGTYAREFTIANGVLSSNWIASPESFGSFGGSPAISASGTSNGVVWLIDSSAGALRAFAADNLADELYNSNQNSGRDALGSATKFSTAAVADGEVFVGTSNGLDIYGLVAPPTSPPTAPTGLSATVISQAQINLSWTNTATNAFGYYVDESTNGGTIWQQIATTGSSSNTYHVGGLTPSTSYQFKVQAFNSLGSSGFTNVASGTTTAAVAPPSFASGFAGAASSMSLNGGATISGSNLIMTDGNGGEDRSAYTNAAISVQGFNTTFTFQDNNGAAADGMAFIMQAYSPTALGMGGGGLAYTGIPNSVCIKFDLYSNNGEGTDSTGLFVNGDSPDVPSGNIHQEATVDMTSSGVVLSSGHQMRVNLAYNGTTLVETVTDLSNSDVFTHNYTINIPSFIGGGYAYLGFGAGTGGSTATQTINTWTYSVVAVAPYTPLNLTVTPTSGTELDLAWNEPYSAVTNFNILELINGNYQQIAQVPGTQTVYPVTGLTSGSSYSFEVVAANSVGSSSPTTAVSGNTPVAPVNVINLQVSNLSTGGVTLTWTNVATNATGINVVRQLESNNSQYLTTLSNTATQYNDTGLLPGAAYDYEIVPVNLAGPAPGVDVVVQTIPIAPTGASANASGTGITLNWDAYGHAVTKWNVYRGTTPGGESATAYASNVTTDNFTDSNLTPGVTYYYTITAVDGGGEGAASTEVHASIASATAVTLSGAVNYIRLDSDGATDVYNNSTGTGTPVQYIASSITVNGSTTPSMLIVDFSNGNPLPISGLSANGSTGGVNLTILGTSGNDTLNVNGTTATFDGAIPINYSSATSITFNGGVGSDVLTQSAGAAALTFAGTTASDTLNVNAGTYTFAAPAAGSGIVPVTLGTLNIAANAQATVANAASHTDRIVLALNSLSIAGASGNWLGTLDLGGNDLDLGSGGLTNPANMVAQAFASGAWTGKGITSSTAMNDPTHLTTLGVIANTTGAATLYGTGGSMGLFDGLNPGSGDVLIKYTYFGDTNLDGKVDTADYTRTDNGFLAAQTGWVNGDLNFDGVVNGSDYTLIDNAFNTQGAALTAVIAATPQAAAANPAADPASAAAALHSDAVQQTAPDLSSTFVGKTTKTVDRSIAPAIIWSSRPITIISEHQSRLEPGYSIMKDFSSISTG